MDGSVSEWMSSLNCFRWSGTTFRCSLTSRVRSVWVNRFDRSGYLQARSRCIRMVRLMERPEPSSTTVWTARSQMCSVWVDVVDLTSTMSKVESGLRCRMSTRTRVFANTKAGSNRLTMPACRACLVCSKALGVS